MKLKFKHKIAVSLINFLSRTWRIETHNFPEKPAIIAFWHGKMLPVWFAFRRRKPIGVVSQSKDGSILSALLLKWNFRLIRGSSSKDGKIVLNEIIDNAKDNFLLITPDGPRGPEKVFKAGAVVAAHRSQSPICLCHAEIESKKIFGRSWDNFELPLPMSKIKLYFSDPEIIDPKSDKLKINSYIARYEQLMNNWEI